MKFSKLPFLMVAVIGVLAVGSAYGQSADEILVRMDKTVNGFDDQFMDNTMTIIDIDGTQKSYRFSILQKGEKRLIRFLTGEMKGLANLIEGPGKIYAYLPGQKKVRRVSAHNMKASFAGSDFTNDDMAFTSWPNNYKATLSKEDDKFWYLDCVAITGKSAPYHRAEVKVEKGSYQLDAWTYYDEADKPVKKFENSDPKDFNGSLRNQIVLVTDLRTGHKTRLDIHDFKVNQGVPDDRFTQRELEWGR